MQSSIALRVVTALDSQFQVWERERKSESIVMCSTVALICASFQVPVYIHITKIHVYFRGISEWHYSNTSSKSLTLPHSIFKLSIILHSILYHQTQKSIFLFQQKNDKSNQWIFIDILINRLLSIYESIDWVISSIIRLKLKESATIVYNYSKKATGTAHSAGITAHSAGITAHSAGITAHPKISGTFLYGRS